MPETGQYTPLALSMKTRAFSYLLLTSSLTISIAISQEVPPPAPQSETAEIVSPEEALKRLRPSEESLLSEAIALQKTQNYGAAVPIFVDILRYYPQGKHHEEVLFRMAECYRSLGRFPEAISTLHLQQKKHSSGNLLPASYLLEGEMLAADKKWKEALPPLKKITSAADPKLKLRASYLLVLG